MGQLLWKTGNRQQSFLLKKNTSARQLLHRERERTKQEGWCFAYPDQLHKLANRELLTIFDSTHTFNVHDYNLFTFMCCNEVAIRVPGANCLVEKGNSNILLTALRKIEELSGFQWKLEYPLSENSAIEKAAVWKASGDEGHVKQHLLCTVHLERTQRR